MSISSPEERAAWYTEQAYNKSGARQIQAITAGAEIDKYLAENAPEHFVGLELQADGIHVTLHEGFDGKLPNTGGVPVFFHYSDKPTRAALRKVQEALLAAISAHLKEFHDLGGGGWCADFKKGAVVLGTPGDLDKVRAFLDKIAPGVAVTVVKGGGARFD